MTHFVEWAYLPPSYGYLRIALQDLLRIRANPLLQQHVQRFFQLSLLIGSQYAYVTNALDRATEPGNILLRQTVNPAQRIIGVLNRWSAACVKRPPQVP